MPRLSEVIAAAPELMGRDYPYIADWLSQKEILENPVKEAEDVPVPVTLELIMANVPSAERVKVRREPGFIEELRAALDGNNRLALAALLEDALTAQAISAGTAQKLQVLLSAKEKDPSWSAYVEGEPRWQKLGLAKAPTAIDVMFAVQLDREPV